MIYIFWTCATLEEAKSIARALLEQHLIACVSFFPNIVSMYRWQGKIEEDAEVKVVLKTEARHFDVICKEIEKRCSYEVPEIVQVAITHGNPRYLSWVSEEVANLPK